MPYMSDFWYRTSLLAMVLIIVASVVVDRLYTSFAHCWVGP